MTEGPPARTVSPGELRRMFNEADYWRRTQSGEFQQRILKDGHPSPPRATEALCTRSMIIAYEDEAGQRVAIVHQYLRTDGTLGGSGRPDPKLLFMYGILYDLLPSEIRE